MKGFIRRLFRCRERPVPPAVVWSDQYPIEGGHVLDLHYDDGRGVRRIVTDTDYRRREFPAFAPRATSIDD